MAGIEILGETFNVLIEGDETKPALLLAHAIGTDVTLWDAQIPAFRQYFRIIRYDGRGHGASAVSQGPYSMERLGRDALAILDALKLDKAHVLGVSLGGMVAQWLLTQAPERISRAVLANSSAHFPNPDIWNSRIAAVRTKGLDAVADAVAERWFTKSFISAGPEKIHALTRLLKATSAEGYAAACSAIRDMDFREALRSVKAKVLVIAGAQDVATPPEMAALIASAIPDAGLVTLEAAHLSNIEAAEQFNQAVIEFLTAPEVSIPTPPLVKAARRPRPVKRTIGTPVANTTGSNRVAAKKMPAKNAPAKTAPVAKAAAKSAAAKPPVSAKAPAKKLAASPAPVQKSPAQKAAASPSNVVKAVTKKLPLRAAAAARPAAKTASVKTAAAKKVMSKAAPGKATPAKKAPAAKAAVQTAPAKKAAVQTAPTKKAAIKKTAAKAAVSQNAPVKKALTKAAAGKAAAPEKAAAKPVATKTAAAKSPVKKTAPAKPGATKKTGKR